jgi:hypothetical protein
MEVLIQAFSVFIRVSEEIGPISSPRLKLLYDEMLMLHQDHMVVGIFRLIVAKLLFPAPGSQHPAHWAVAGVEWQHGTVR